jgi:ATP-dependent RNA helicase RhlE
LTFKDFNLNEQLLEGLASMNYNKPTPIQEEAIPHILNNKDLIACAQTGTGKTAAYLLPILHKIVSNKSHHINTIIISPTRELALQIDQALEGFAYFIPVSSFPVYGGGDGAAFDREKKALKEGGADIIIATPGRLISHLTSGYVKTDHLQHLILDEADRMLDMGFHDDIMRIINYLPKTRQTLLFSATMPPKIRTLAAKILNDPAQVSIAVSKPAVGVVQEAYVVYENQKIPLLMDILKGKEAILPSIIIFCSTKINVKILDKELRKLRLSVKAFHSDLEQSERESIMSEFRSRQLQMLVATDIISRGIDIENISMVVNYDVPNEPEDYIHRIGRTARAETTGIAITFINEADQKKFSRIEAQIGREIPKSELPAALGPGPLYQPLVEKKKKKKFSSQKKKTGDKN